MPQLIQDLQVNQTETEVELTATIIGNWDEFGVSKQVSGSLLIGDVSDDALGENVRAFEFNLPYQGFREVSTTITKTNEGEVTGEARVLLQEPSLEALRKDVTLTPPPGDPVTQEIIQDMSVSQTNDEVIVTAELRLPMTYENPQQISGRFEISGGVTDQVLGFSTDSAVNPDERITLEARTPKADIDEVLDQQVVSLTIDEPEWSFDRVRLTVQPPSKDNGNGGDGPTNGDEPTNGDGPTNGDDTREGQEPVNGTQPEGMDITTVGALAAAGLGAAWLLSR